LTQAASRSSTSVRAIVFASLSLLTVELFRNKR